MAYDAPSSKPQLYAGLVAQAHALLADEHDLIAAAANLAAMAFHALPDINWAGFYLFDGTQLVVGPFQGKPACVRIPLGQGVCGTAAQRRETQVVEDVHAFPGHIACDAASRSEIVVPLVRTDGSLLGVWDVDSPLPARFDAEDCAGMEALCAAFLRAVDGEASRMKTGNLFAALPQDLNEEAFEQLAGRGAVRIERIVSRGHRSPESGWYDQTGPEWVAVLRGAARLGFDDGSRLTLRAGDYLDIPAHRRHRVEWTAPDTETVWLAVHY